MKALPNKAFGLFRTTDSIARTDEPDLQILNKPKKISRKSPRMGDLGGECLGGKFAPGLLMFNHGVKTVQQFVRTSNQSHFLRLPRFQ